MPFFPFCLLPLEQFTPSHPCNEAVRYEEEEEKERFTEQIPHLFPVAKKKKKKKHKTNHIPQAKTKKKA
jgi:hypothetical protein